MLLPNSRKWRNIDLILVFQEWNYVLTTEHPAAYTSSTPERVSLASEFYLVAKYWSSLKHYATYYKWAAYFSSQEVRWESSGRRCWNKWAVEAKGPVTTRQQWSERKISINKSLQRCPRLTWHFCQMQVLILKIWSGTEGSTFLTHSRVMLLIQVQRVAPFWVQNSQIFKIMPSSHMCPHPHLFFILFYGI